MWSFLKLIAWGLIWIPAWLATTIARRVKKRPRLDNCLTWSLRKWDEEGGYLVIRWCRSNRVPFIRWPHFLWLPEDKHDEVRHFIPKHENQELKFFPDLWFEGKVQKGDPLDEMEN